MDNLTNNQRSNKIPTAEFPRKNRKICSPSRVNLERNLPYSSNQKRRKKRPKTEKAPRFYTTLHNLIQTDIVAPRGIEPVSKV
jgi:hypothetical protein